jgi:hypothetical protein
MNRLAGRDRLTWLICNGMSEISNSRAAQLPLRETGIILQLSHIVIVSLQGNALLAKREKVNGTFV